MRTFAILMAAVFATSAGVYAEAPENKPLPPDCRQDAQGLVDYKACFEVAEPKSGLWLLSVINLGSEAFWNGQMTEAARYYDLSTANGINTSSDIILHSNRTIVFRKVGRLEDSLLDARLAWSMVQKNSFDGFDAPLPDDAKSYALLAILETFHQTNAPEFQVALDAYLLMPLDAINTVNNKAAILAEVGHVDEALKINAEQLNLTPDDPVLLNNQCYVLTTVGRASEGLPYCKLANELQPGAAHILHSLAAANAALGNCEAAETALKAAQMLEPATVIYQQSISCSPAG